MQCPKNILGRQRQGLIPLLKGTRIYINHIFIYNFFAHHSRPKAVKVKANSESNAKAEVPKRSLVVRVPVTTSFRQWTNLRSVINLKIKRRRPT